MIVVVWVVSFIISVLFLFGWIDSLENSLYKENMKECSLIVERGYIIYFLFGLFFIFFIIMIFVYIKIFFVIREWL